MTDTCTICGCSFSEPSMGGPGICAACDCGIPPTQSKMRAEINDLRAKLAAAEAESAERLHRLSDAEAKLAAAEAQRDGAHQDWQNACRLIDLERERAINAERERDEARVDAGRVDFLIDIITGEGPAEDDRRAVAMALAFAQGLDARAAIDTAMAAISGGKEGR